MKPFPFLMLCASSLLGFCTGLPAMANPNPEFAAPQIALNQSAADLERQRAAEQAIKDAERIRQENRNTASPNDPSYGDRQRLEERTNQTVDRLRENVTDPQGLQQSQAELNRLQRERNSINGRSNYYPYYQDQWNLSPGSGTVIEQQEANPNNNTGAPPQENTSNNSSDRGRGGTLSVSTGFKDGTVNPAIGYRLPNSNIGFEVGAVLNQDALPPGNLNEYPAPIQQFPNGFNNLGVKTTTPNIGADVIGYYDVSPQVSLHGGVGVYFQGSSQITQSKATTDLFKETNQTNVNLAVSGGADFRVSDSLRIGAGYHSLRGVTAKIGYEF